MEITVTQVIEGIVLLGAGVGVKQIWPTVKAHLKNKSEENKLKIKMGSGSSDEVAGIWKSQYDEVKLELKETIEHKIALEIKLATLRERLLKNIQHSRGGHHKKDKNDEN